MKDETIMELAVLGIVFLSALVISALLRII